MNITRWCAAAVAAVAMTVGWHGAASAQQFSVTITFDENCNGTFSTTAGFFEALPCQLFADAGPGGLAAALTYDMFNPPGLVPGDLILLEPDTGTTSDVVRFNPTSFTGGAGSIVFYSDNLDGADALADIGFPTGFYTNVLTVTEVGPEGNNGFTYTPTAGQPGFVTEAAGPVTYVIQSDLPTVPEPATLALLGIALAGLGFARCARKH